MEPTGQGRGGHKVNNFCLYSRCSGAARVMELFQEARKNKMKEAAKPLCSFFDGSRNSVLSRLREDGIFINVYFYTNRKSHLFGQLSRSALGSLS